MKSPRLLALGVAALLSGMGVTLLGTTAAHAAERVHVVARGQTLYQIARRYHVGVDALREANGLGPREQIHPGLSLSIPGKGTSPSAPAAEPKARAEKGAKRGAASKAAPAAKPPAAEADDPPPRRAFRGPRRRGVVRMVRGTETLEVQLVTRHGRIAPTALSHFSQMLRSSGGSRLTIDARLAALVGQVSDHFGGRTLHVVSGFRPYSPVQYTPHSNHNLGRAMDFSVEGIPNTVLRDYCRTFRDAGVGYYPNSTFVHLDVRAGKAFWIDHARPGEPPRYDASTPHRSGTGAPDEPEAHDSVGGQIDPEDGSR